MGNGEGGLTHSREVGVFPSFGLSKIITIMILLFTEHVLHANLHIYYF